MGSLATHSFGNDGALDWLNDLFDEQDPYFIRNTLEIIVDFPPHEKPESWDCCCALAAAEIVAAASGQPSCDLPPQVKEWLDAYDFKADEEALTLARKAVQRIQSDSELKDEWLESSSSQGWYHCLTDLGRRLGI